MFFLYSIPGKAYALRHVGGKTRKCLVMSPYLIKAMRKFYVFNNIIYQKYKPTQSSIYSFVWYQFDIFLCGFIWWKINWRYGKNFDLLQLIIPQIMRILLAFSYFPTFREIWSPPVLPLLYIIYIIYYIWCWVRTPISYVSNFTAGAHVGRGGELRPLQHKLGMVSFLQVII